MKILYVTTIGITMCFFPEHIRMLLDEGHIVEVACNNETSSVPDYCREWNLKIHNIPFSRSPFSKDNLVAYRELKKLVTTEEYDIVHTHTPNASVCVRLACRKLRKNGLKVFYTAHGFHFYQGAPLKNWIIYYPLEKLCSRWTDVLITINHEDYEIAKSKMHAIHVEEIPGIGIDLSRFTDCRIDRNAVREEFGIKPEDKVLIYIAELNENKNQSSLIQMLAEFRKIRSDVKLMLVGKGDSEAVLKEQCEKFNVRDCVIFTGYRSDVPALLKASDVAVPSSIREGFGLNVIEAMACKIPVVAYDNRGHRTIIRNGENGFMVPMGNYKAMAEKVNLLLNDSQIAESISKTAFSELKKYTSENVIALMRKIYQLESEQGGFVK
ncbi:MAG: glycosyltransferase family 4 protein [Lachnospiraceae bacterium]|nr:glycosyltransferase family 4 protein [Lachnospiraceae bacterium]